MVLTKEERKTIEMLYNLTAFDRKNLTEVFVNLGSLLVLSTVSNRNAVVTIPCVGQFRRHTETGAWMFLPAPSLSRSVEQAKDRDAGEIDGLAIDAITHLFRERV